MSLAQFDVARIRALRTAGIKDIAIAAEYRIGGRTVSKICRREIRQDVPWWEEWMVYQDGRAFP